MFDILTSGQNLITDMYPKLQTEGQLEVPVSLVEHLDTTCKMLQQKETRRVTYGQPDISAQPPQRQSLVILSHVFP